MISNNDGCKSLLAIKSVEHEHTGDGYFDRKISKLVSKCNNYPYETQQNLI